MWQWEATSKVVSQNNTTVFQSYFCARDYLKPSEGGLLLVLSKKIDVVVISVPEEHLFSLVEAMVHHHYIGLVERTIERIEWNKG